MDLLSEFCQLVRFLKEQVRTTTLIATAVSHVLQPHDGRIRFPVDRNRNFFLPSHVDFSFISAQCVDNWK